jgi:hypothetical protein
MTALPRFATFNGARRMSVDGSSRDARLPEPLRQSVDVGLVTKREPRDVLGKRVFGVDLHQLAPYAAGFPGFAQVPECDGKEGAR